MDGAAAVAPRRSDRDALLPRNHVVDGWRIIARLGKGTFSEIYLASHVETSVLCALKIDKATHRDSQNLKWESDLLLRLQRFSIVPRHYGLLGGGRVLAMQLLGASVSEVRDVLPGKQFPLGAALGISAQMLAGVEACHSEGFVHRDVKPSNFVLRGGGSGMLCVLDFGQSREYRELGSRVVRPARPTAEFRGTSMYASIRVHQGKDSGRVDDLWSWFYAMVDLVRGGVPWRPWRTDRVRCGSLKQHYADHPQELLDGLPCAAQLARVQAILAATTFSQKPDYAALGVAVDDARAVVEAAGLAATRMRPPYAMTPALQARLDTLDGSAGATTAVGLPPLDISSPLSAEQIAADAVAAVAYWSTPSSSDCLLHCRGGSWPDDDPPPGSPGAVPTPPLPPHPPSLFLMGADGRASREARALLASLEQKDDEAYLECIGFEDVEEASSASASSSAPAWLRALPRPTAKTVNFNPTGDLRPRSDEFIVAETRLRLAALPAALLWGAWQSVNAKSVAAAAAFVAHVDAWSALAEGLRASNACARWVRGGGSAAAGVGAGVGAGTGMGATAGRTSSGAASASPLLGLSDLRVPSFVIEIVRAVVRAAPIEPAPFVDADWAAAAAAVDLLAATNSCGATGDDVRGDPTDVVPAATVVSWARSAASVRPDFQRLAKLLKAYAHVALRATTALCGLEVWLDIVTTEGRADAESAAVAGAAVAARTAAAPRVPSPAGAAAEAAARLTSARLRATTGPVIATVRVEWEAMSAPHVAPNALDVFEKTSAALAGPDETPLLLGGGKAWTLTKACASTTLPKLLGPGVVSIDPDATAEKEPVKESGGAAAVAANARTPAITPILPTPPPAPAHHAPIAHSSGAPPSRPLLPTPGSAPPQRGLLQTPGSGGAWGGGAPPPQKRSRFSEEGQ